MRIGVVSDTHSLDIPQVIIDDFKNVSLIIHAGDLCSLKELELFKKICEVKAVYGNMDDSDIRKVLPKREIFEIENVTIGIVHGEGPANKVLDFIVKEFKDQMIDVIIFGHSHQPTSDQIGKTLYFNPGSPNDELFAPYKSYGILEIKNGKINAEIIKLE